MMKAFTLVGIDGNAFSIMSYTVDAMEKAGFSSSEIADYQHDCMSSDYDSLIAKSTDMLDQCNDILDLDDDADEEDEFDDDDEGVEFDDDHRYWYW